MGSILFRLIRNLEPSSCVELGSCVGISASYQAGALSLNKKGQIIISVNVNKQNLDLGKQALKRAAHKLPGSYTMAVNEMAK